MRRHIADLTRGFYTDLVAIEDHPVTGTKVIGDALRSALSAARQGTVPVTQRRGFRRLCSSISERFCTEVQPSQAQPKLHCTPPPSLVGCSAVCNIDG